MLKKFNNGSTIDELCAEYKKVGKYMKRLLRELGADLIDRV